MHLRVIYLTQGVKDCSSCLIGTEDVAKCIKLHQTFEDECVWYSIDFHLTNIRARNACSKMPVCGETLLNTGCVFVFSDNS